MQSLLRFASSTLHIIFACLPIPPSLLSALRSLKDMHPCLRFCLCFFASGQPFDDLIFGLVSASEEESCCYKYCWLMVCFELKESACVTLSHFWARKIGNFSCGVRCCWPCSCSYCLSSYRKPKRRDLQAKYHWCTLLDHVYEATSLHLLWDKSALLANFSTYQPLHSIYCS